uniref:DUF3037 domain-containing protein n=1 Tax=Psychrobacter sp. (strain PRwf-1) TaxID=349106 RepID=A5WF45_PSYWF
MNWREALSTEGKPRPHRVSGKFQVIRFMPNLVAQEIFNIGIVFIDNQNKRHIRMLNNAKAFECLYGKAGAAQVQNMLTYANDVTESLGESASLASPHLSYSEPLFTQGLTADQILSSLYDEYINLICNDEATTAKRGAINTDNLRKKVFSRLRKINPRGYNDILHEDPIIVERKNEKIELNLPIWKYDKLFEDSFFATIISADFIPEAYLGYNLDTLGAMNLQAACEIQGSKSKAGFFIYCPNPDTSDINEADYLRIKTHINKTLKNVQYVASRTNTILDYKVSENLETLNAAVLDFTSA